MFTNKKVTLYLGLTTNYGKKLDKGNVKQTIIETIPTDACTIIETNGVWKGETEESLKIEFIVENEEIGKDVLDYGERLTRRFSQDVVLATIEDTQMKIIS